MAALSLQARENVWQDFADAAYPRAKLESARATAIFLAKAGEDGPSRIIDFLDTIITADPETLDTGIVVPNNLIRYETDATKLPLSNISYPETSQLALLPAPLLDDWNLESENSDAISPLATLPPLRFTPKELAAALDAYHAQANRALTALPKETIRALDSYFSQKSELLENQQFTPILEIHKAFEFGPEQAFIGFDERGLLIPGSPMNLAIHLNELLEALLNQSNDLALQSSAFRQTLTLAANQDNSLEVASTIHQAFSKLDLGSRDSSNPLLRIRTLWEAAFIRDDLMEQTILGYTLEAIETAKLELAHTRSKFSQSELALYQKSQLRQQQIQNLKQASTTANSAKEWIVISKHSHKLRRSQP